MLSLLSQSGDLPSHRDLLLVVVFGLSLWPLNGSWFLKANTRGSIAGLVVFGDEGIIIDESLLSTSSNFSLSLSEISPPSSSSVAWMIGSPVFLIQESIRKFTKELLPVTPSTSISSYCRECLLIVFTVNFVSICLLLFDSKSLSSFPLYESL